MRFKATHVIEDGLGHEFEVMVRNGFCYTEEEWEGCAMADWTFDSETALLLRSGHVVDGATIRRRRRVDVVNP